MVSEMDRNNQIRWLHQMALICLFFSDLEMASSIFSLHALRHCAVNACLLPVCYFHGKAVTTVEGIGSIRTKLHDVQVSLMTCSHLNSTQKILTMPLCGLQRKLVEANGTQCGFCTPGIVMSMYTLLRNQPTPSFDSILDALKGLSSSSDTGWTLSADLLIVSLIIFQGICAGALDTDRSWMVFHPSPLWVWLPAMLASYHSGFIWLCMMLVCCSTGSLWTGGRLL